MNKISTLTSLPGRKLVHEVFHELRYSRNRSSIATLLTLWRICTFEKRLNKYVSKDIFSDLKSGAYFYSGGWQIKGLYSMVIGFVFAASTIWNVELRFLQSFAWLIGAFTSYITYYLLASD